MDSAIVDKVKQLVEAATPSRRIVSLPGEPEGVYGLVGPDGNIVRARAINPPASEDAADLETLVALAKRRSEAPGAGRSMSIWYDRELVQAVDAHAADPADVCSLDLKPSPQLSLLKEWRAKGSVTVAQKELVTLLRTTFDGCWNRQPTLLDAVRKLRTSRVSEGGSEIQRGKMSLSKDIIASMTGVQDIPEQVTFEVPVFDGAAVRVTAQVRVVLDPDPESERFLVVVLPEEIERAYAVGEDRVEGMLTGLLDGAEIPVYHGRP